MPSAVTWGIRFGLTAGLAFPLAAWVQLGSPSLAFFAPSQPAPALSLAPVEPQGEPFELHPRRAAYLLFWAST